MKLQHTIRKKTAKKKKKIVQLNEAVIKSERKELVRGSVEEALNELPEAETKELLPQAIQYERNGQRQGYCSGHSSRNLTTTSGRRHP